MSDLKRILLLGTGPAAIQLAVLFKNRLNCHIGIVGRESVRSESFFTALKQNNRRIHADIQNEKHQQLEGDGVIDQIFRGYDTITGEWDTVILSVTTDAYLKVLQQMSRHLLQQVKCILLVSPTFGSNSLLRQYMSEISSDVEIISFSTYLGDTRWIDDKPSNRVITTGMKKKVYMGSTHGATENVKLLCELYEQLGINLEVMASPIEAETRNISLYVHPALFMNDFSLNVIFGNKAAKKYVYKMFPEGPITQDLIRNMLAGWKEITNVVSRLNIQGVNLIKFMIDDNYPVRTESISRYDIDHFVELEAIHQQYLLYVRYTSLLIDPYSEPDSEGRYFDFSAVPIRTIFVNREGKWDIPRMPKEDYYRIKIIQGIARYTGTSCPTIDTFIAVYERKLEEAAQALKREALSEAFTVQSFEEDLKRICSDIGRRIGSGTAG